MKKLISIIMLAIICLSLAACGGEAPKDESVNGQTTTTTTTEFTTLPHTFDTSWASNDFEKLIPELPFEGWTVKSETDTVYKLEIIGLNTSAATNPPDSGEKDGADKDTLVAYIDNLLNYNFEVHETAQGYKWIAIDADNNEIEFMIGDGGCWVTITKK